MAKIHGVSNDTNKPVERFVCDYCFDGCPTMGTLGIGMSKKYPPKYPAKDGMSPEEIKAYSNEKKEFIGEIVGMLECFDEKGCKDCPTYQTLQKIKGYEELVAKVSEQSVTKGVGYVKWGKQMLQEIDPLYKVDLKHRQRMPTNKPKLVEAVIEIDEEAFDEVDQG